MLHSRRYQLHPPGLKRPHLPQEYCPLLSVQVPDIGIPPWNHFTLWSLNAKHDMAYLAASGDKCILPILRLATVALGNAGLKTEQMG